MKILSKVVISILILLFVSFSVCACKTVYDIKTTDKQENYNFHSVKIPSEDALNRFSGGLKIKTISNPVYENTDFRYFDEFISYIQEQYPLIFSACEFELINNYGIVLKLNGKNKENKPNLLTAHYDVVGVKDESKWEHPPFSGFYDDKYMYSRGTIDDKGSVFAILEALNGLLENNYTPQSDLYIAFSQAEETGSPEGAPKIIEYFKSQNISFNTALDEGGRIVDKNGKYYAFIGISEKGRLLTKVTVHGTGSHASSPSSDLAVVKLAKLISAFSNNKPKAVLTKEIRDYYKKTYNSYNLIQKILISNTDILRPLFYKEFSKNAEDNARLHSTLAITVIEASNVQNAVSNDASMLIDARILPSQSRDDIKQFINKIISKTLPNEDVTVEYIGGMEPCPPSNTDSDEYKQLVNNIQKLYPNMTAAPYMTLGATDAREYAEISDNTYRFLPCILTQEDAALMHSDNEKLSLENWARMIDFYKEFMLDR